VNPALTSRGWALALLGALAGAACLGSRPTALGGGADAARGNAGAGAPAVAHSGDPCSTKDSKACQARATDQRLNCDGTRWVVHGNCPLNQRCDGRPGPTAGECLPIIAGCETKQPGGKICVGGAVHLCGEDLVTSTPSEACSPEASDCEAGSCTCSGKVCGGTCVHPATDPNHCGDCGRRCEDTCANGTCIATVLAPAPGAAPGVTAGGLAVDATSVYWTSPDLGTVNKVGLAGGNSVVLATDQGKVAGLAVDATSVYWTSTDNGTVMKAHLDGQSPMIIDSSVTMPGQLALDADAIYWATLDGDVWKASKNGGGRARLAQGQGQATFFRTSWWMPPTSTGSRSKPCW
jgi:hypothetical protein